jgi:hypothetical protein
MVHALERARRHLAPGATLVLIQPHQWKRPFIAVRSARKREPVAALVNPFFQPLINSAVGSVDSIVERGLLERIGTSHREYRAHLVSLAELRRYLHLGQQPPRFPSGARHRLDELWRNRAAGAQIEVTEHVTVTALRATSPHRRLPPT